MVNVRKQTIAKYVGALKALHELIYKTGEVNKEQLNRITKQHKCSNDILFSATKVGVFKRVSHGRYLTNTNNIEPIHARKVAQYKSNRMVKSRTTNNMTIKDVVNYNISNAIGLLKRNGYKIMKPITEFKEV